MKRLTPSPSAASLKFSAGFQNKTLSGMEIAVAENSGDALIFRSRYGESQSILWR
jgi:hypothetical protein